MRRYYLHTRRGIYYVEFVVQETGLKLAARSTGTKDRDEALLKVSEWLKNGIPTGAEKKLRPVEAAAGIEEILKGIGKSSLNSDDAMRIVALLRKLELIDIPAIKHNTEPGLLHLLSKKNRKHIAWVHGSGEPSLGSRHLPFLP